jgi:hypothetical protein
MGNELTTFEMFLHVVCVVDFVFWAGYATIGVLLVWHEELVGKASEE